MRQLVDFDDLEDATAVTNQYARWFTVSSAADCALETSANYDFGQSAPNYVTTYWSCDDGETADVAFTFARPVRKVSFLGIGVNGHRGVALMKVTHADGSVTEAPLDGMGDAMTPVPVTVPDEAPITKLLITNITDEIGLGFDDLAFDFPE